VSPTECIRADIDDLFASEGDLGEALEKVARLGARLLLQAALEAEVTEFLGRNRYERRALAREARGRIPQRLRPADGEDHGGADHPGAP